jgi:hypothetical protein
MKLTLHRGGLVRVIAAVFSLALPLLLTVSAADARVGGGISSGSRGARTFSAPPSTSTAPGTAQPFNRSITQPNGTSAPSGGGFFNQPGRGLLGGLAAGFLGAGLLGMLFGGGMFSGIGGFSSLLGMILQIGLIVFLVRMAMSWWQRRNAPAYAGAVSPGGSASFRSGTGFGLGSGSAPLEITPADYEASSDCLSISRARIQMRMSPGCTPSPRRRWCPISAGILPTTTRAARSTGFPM